MSAWVTVSLPLRPLAANCSITGGFSASGYLEQDWDNLHCQTPPPTPQDVWKDQDKIKTCTAWCIFFWGIKHHWAGHGQNQNSDIQLFLFSVQKWSLLTVHAEPSPWAHWNNQFYTQFPPQYYWQMHCSHPFTALIILRCHSSSNISLALLSPRSNTLKHAESVRIGTHSLTHHI